MHPSRFALRHSAVTRPAGARPVRTRVAIVAFVALGALVAVLIALTSSGAGPRPVVTRPVVSTPATTPATTAAPAAGTGPPQAVVRVPARAATIGIPTSFLGISTEYWTIPVWARHLPLLGRVLSLITPDGPMVLRIGGSSADQTRWAPRRELPEWVFETTPAWLAQVRSIVRRSGVRVILDLNMVTASPTIAVRWARAAEAALPSESIIGFEIGNEGDIYSPSSWRKLTGGSKALPPRLTASGYAASYQAYAQQLMLLDPGVPLLGPALSDPVAHYNWISQLLAGPHPALRAVTVHRYPLSACSAPSAPTYPTIARVLSERSSAGMAATIRRSVAAAKAAGLPLRLTEINSVTCGGRRGVSNTFATALWAPDALFELLRAGASSAAVHVRHNAVNMAFSLTSHGLDAKPLLYGLSVFARTLGPGAQLVPVSLQARGVRPAPHLKAWAVRSQTNTLHVLLINKGSRPARVALRLPVTGPITTEQLLARSARARSGVTFAGQHLSARGYWVGRRVSQTVAPVGAGYRVTVRGVSATLVTATVAAGALGVK